MPHHGSRKSFPDNPLNYFRFFQDSIAIATRHPSNSDIVGNTEDIIAQLDPINDVMQSMISTDPEGSGLKDIYSIQAFDHDFRRYSENTPFLYSYVYDVENATLFWYRFFLNNGIFSQRFLEDNAIHIKDKNYLMKTNKQIPSSEASKNNYVKVLLTWINSRIVSYENTMNL
jgi:hypothetical protein